MKKLIGIIVLVVLVVAIVGGVFLFRNLGPIVKRVVESIGGKALGAPVTIETVSLSPFSGAGQIEGLVVANPEGFRSANAFSLGRVGIDVDLKSLRGARTVINEILVDAPEITLEMTLRGKSNLGQLVENVEAYAGNGENLEEPAESRPVVIRDLLIRNAKVRLNATALGGSSAELDLPEIRLTDIGEEGSEVKTAQVLELVLATVVKSVLATVGDADEIVAKVLEGVDGAARQSIDKARDELVGRVAGIEGNLAGELGAALGGVGGVLGEGVPTLGGILGGLTGAPADRDAGQGESAAAGKAVDEQADDVADKVTGEASKALKGIGGLFGGNKGE